MALHRTMREHLPREGRTRALGGRSCSASCALLWGSINQRKGRVDADALDQPVSNTNATSNEARLTPWTARYEIQPIPPI